jgi:hypothetical protein
MGDSPVDVVKRWEEHGADWRVVALSDDHVSIDLCTCSGEPVDRLDSGDRELIEFVASRLSALG